MKKIILFIFSICAVIAQAQNTSEIFTTESQLIPITYVSSNDLGADDSVKTSISNSLSVSGTSESFQNGCWINIYRDTNYGGDSLTVNGPAAFMNMKSLPNSNQDWGDQIGSIKTGPNCWVVLYADDDFGDTSMVVGPSSEIPDLADLEDEVDSMKILNHRP